jgi:hypothetical protein
LRLSLKPKPQLHIIQLEELLKNQRLLMLNLKPKQLHLITLIIQSEELKNQVMKLLRLNTADLRLYQAQADTLLEELLKNQELRELNTLLILKHIHLVVVVTDLVMF